MLKYVSAIVSFIAMGHFLPITADEVNRLGWDAVDIVLVSGDAYVDHPSFGTAVIGRTLEAAGYRVAILPQPNWRDDLRDFKKFGQPKLFFGVTSGVMDSMVNHYTAARRLRHDDAYTPGGNSGFRPDYATYVYTRILKQLYPDTPVVIGGIEASMRRLSHYDYWSDTLKPSILFDTHADVLIYGMGEKTILKVAHAIECNELRSALPDIPQVGFVADKSLWNNLSALYDGRSSIMLHSYEQCRSSKRKEAENFFHIEQESNKIAAVPLVQRHADEYVVINAPEPPMTTEEIDQSFALPYLRRPHPKYKKRGTIPAFEMIRWSVNIHRGCFGGCSFCTISAHQGKQIVSRSEQSVIQEVNSIVSDPEFHGVISDLGGPSANMYRMGGKDKSLCVKCSRYSCSQPKMCSNLDSDHTPLLRLCRTVASIPGVNHLYIGSGIRCDLFTESNHGWQYFRQIVLNHVGGRLKVAPEHTSAKVLDMMRKPHFELFEETKRQFDNICNEAGRRYQLIPYFISSHPGCSLRDMAELAVKMKQMNYQLEQIQDFTPTPMTLSTEMYYTGINPTTMQPIFVARHPNEKKEQRQLFFFYKKELKPAIRQSLIKSGNGHFLKQLGL